jgi:hypothetical protein
MFCHEYACNALSCFTTYLHLLHDERLWPPSPLVHLVVAVRASLDLLGAPGDFALDAVSLGVLGSDETSLKMNLKPVEPYMFSFQKHILRGDIFLMRSKRAS